MLPVVERGPSWTEALRFPGQTGGPGTIRLCCAIILCGCHWGYYVHCLYTSNCELCWASGTALPSLLLTSEGAKWGLQMGRADPCAAKIILGLGSTISHPKLPCEVWLGTVWLCWSLNYPAWAPTKGKTWQAKESTEHLGPGVVKSHFLELVSSHFSSSALA